jgi:hypothetical protein
VQETVIRDDEEAIAARCIASPTIRVDGLDVEYMEREPEERSAGLRYFSTPRVEARAGEGHARARVAEGEGDGGGLLAALPCPAPAPSDAGAGVPLIGVH